MYLASTWQYTKTAHKLWKQTETMELEESLYTRDEEGKNNTRRAQGSGGSLRHHLFFG